MKIKYRYLFGSLLWVSLFVQSTMLLAGEGRERDIEKLLARNRYYEVLDLIDSLCLAEGESPNLLYYAGRANEGILRYNNAYRYYKAWYEQDTTNREAAVFVARLAQLAGHSAEALQRYEKLAAQDSFQFAINYSLGRIYQQAGKLLPAIQAYRRLLSVDTANVTLLIRLGECYADMGLLPVAVAYYQQAFFLNPQNVKLAVRTVNSIINKGDVLSAYMERAEQILDTALSRNPFSVVLLQTQGVVKYLRQQYAACDRIFSFLLEKGDSSRMNFKYAGLAALQQKKYFQAYKYLKYADSLYKDQEGNRTDLEIALKYGENLGEIGMEEEALLVFDELQAQLEPDKRLLSQLSAMRGKVYYSTARKEQAIRAYWKAYQLNPNNIQALYGLAYLNFIGENEEMTAQQIVLRKQKMLFVHALFLRKVKSKGSAQYNFSRDVVKQALDEAFFKNEQQLVAVDPDGKKYVYSQEEIRQLLKEN